MSLLLIALALIIIGGLLALAFCKNSFLSTILGAGGTVIGCIIGLIPVGQTIYYGDTTTIRLVWNIPYGSFFLKLDPLSAFFLLPIFVLSGLAAIYGREYMMAYRDKKWLGLSWFFFNLLIASMAFVCLAHNAILFLISWEVMALSSFFLVAFEYEKIEVRKASWIYMVASYIGTAFLLPMFLIFGSSAGSLDFDVFTQSLSSGAANICFILRLSASAQKQELCLFMFGCLLRIRQRRAPYRQLCRAL